MRIYVLENPGGIESSVSQHSSQQLKMVSIGMATTTRRVSKPLRSSDLRQCPVNTADSGLRLDSALFEFGNYSLVDPVSSKRPFHLEIGESSLSPSEFLVILSKPPYTIATLPGDQLDELFGLGSLNDQGRAVLSNLQNLKLIQKNLPAPPTQTSTSSSPYMVAKFEEARKFYDAERVECSRCRTHEDKARRLQLSKGCVTRLAEINWEGSVLRLLRYGHEFYRSPSANNELAEMLSCDLLPRQEILENIEKNVARHKNRIQNQCQKEGSTAVETKLESVWRKKPDLGARQMVSKLTTEVNIAGAKAEEKNGVWTEYPFAAGMEVMCAEAEAMALISTTFVREQKASPFSAQISPKMAKKDEANARGNVKR
ncbi:hypothetical protein BDZ45DRAFT_744488 [Acephala macrosclerotiorum]|nr:hypothetical protein BDZ45DRAFT_744488 [Acephala macrosclerotiorum]